MSGLAQAQLFLAIEFVRLVLRNLQYYRRVLSGVPSGSGGYFGVGNTIWMMMKMLILLFLMIVISVAAAQVGRNFARLVDYIF